VPEAATFDSAAFLAPAAFTALLGIALCFVAALGIALGAAPTFAATLLAGIAVVARNAALLFG
jgi:hypothetical protein